MYHILSDVIVKRKCHLNVDISYFIQYPFWHNNGHDWTNSIHPKNGESDDVELYMAVSGDVNITRAEGQLVIIQKQ